MSSIDHYAPVSSELEPRSNSLFALFGFVAMCLGVSLVGGYVTSTELDTWYADLNKPIFNPPNWLFAPVWTGLYILMALAAWRVWQLPESRVRSLSLTLFTVQIAFNLIWSVIFFGMQNIGLAFAEIILLLALIAANTAMFWRLDWLAGTFFTPYLAWVGYATVLNGAFWLLN